MTIRISEPLVTLLLKEPIDLAFPDRTLQQHVEACGGRIQSILVETVAHARHLLCPCCLEPLEETDSRSGIEKGVCGQCGEVFVAFRRAFKKDEVRWFSFSPK